MSKEGLLYYYPSHDSYFIEGPGEPIKLQDGDVIEYEISSCKIRAKVSYYSRAWNLSKGRLRLQDLEENQIPVTLIEKEAES